MLNKILLWILASEIEFRMTFFTSRVAAESYRGACSEAAEEEEEVDICFFSHGIFIASLLALL